MESDRGMAIPGGAEHAGREDAWGTDGKAVAERTGPTWRGFVLAILAAILLSVTTTLLLGGSWSSYTLNPAAAGPSGGCGAGGSCCPPPDSGK